MVLKNKKKNGVQRTAANFEPSVFVDFFGDYPLVRVLDFLVENDAFDYCKKDICKNAGVSWNTLESLWKTLDEKEIVLFTRKVGKSPLYKLNTKNPNVQRLIEFDRSITKKSLESVEPEKIKIKALASVR